MFIALMVVLGIIWFVALVAYLYFRRAAKNAEYDSERHANEFGRTIAFAVGVAVPIVAALLWAAMSFMVVSARSVTIVTTLGANPQVYQPGPHWVSPWSDRESYTTLNQSIDLNDRDGSAGNAVKAAFSAPENPDKPGEQQQAGGGKGTISAVPNWHVDQSGQGAALLWTKYKTQDEAAERLVKPAAIEVIGTIANDYTAGLATVNQDVIGTRAAAALQAKLGQYGIVIDSVQIRGVDLDDKTQASLQKIVDAYNTGQQYAIDKANSAIQNDILKERREAGALTREANERYCLDLVKSWDFKEQGTMPPTFSCFGGAGSGVLVQVPSK